MRELSPSDHVLSDTVAARDLFGEQGYLYFRGVLDVDVIESVRRGVIAWFVGRGLAEVHDGNAKWLGRRVPWAGIHPAGLFETNLHNSLARHRSMRRIYETAFGEPGYVLPIIEYQSAYPGMSGLGRAHQDAPSNPGLHFAVFWVPLVEMPEPVGGLAIAPGFHRAGSLQARAGQPGWLPHIPDDRVPPDAWGRADYRPGDVLVFHGMTPHVGMENTSQVMRLSIDVRAQPVSAPRPTIGVVISAADHRIEIADETAGRVELTVDDRTVLRLPSGRLGVDDIGVYLGERVIATRDGERALLVRFPPRRMAIANT